MSSTRLMTPARAPQTPAAPAPAKIDPAAAEPGTRSTGSLIRTAGEQLDQFDRVMEKLRSSMGGGALTYGGAPSMGQGQIVDRLA
ncbi:hypothetical protein ASE95_02510 [Sphingomonas sp. Leaf231]|nr:hypothetical protein ASE95_02510 [Sphingomonas sp. Leaf231]